MNTILIIDDHAGFRVQARAILEADGFIVVGEADDGASGLAAARSIRPDLVLLDIGLPDIEGFDVARMNSYEVHGLRVSSSAVRAALAAGDMASVAGLLGRPYSISGRVIHGRKLGRQLGASRPGAGDGLRRRAQPLASERVSADVQASPVQGQPAASEGRSDRKPPWMPILGAVVSVLSLAGVVWWALGQEPPTLPDTPARWAALAGAIALYERHGFVTHHTNRYLVGS